MNDFFANRYTKLALLTLAVALLLYLLQMIIFMVLPLDLPQFLRILLALLAAGYLVYKFFSERVF